MRYFKIEGIIEVNEKMFYPEARKDMLDSLLDEFLNEFCYSNYATFGGGIKEVDSDGEDLKNIES